MSSRVPALCPSKSGLMNKHIVKHIVKRGGFGLMNKHIVASYLGFRTLQFSGSLEVNDPFFGCPVPV
jgi:hypothetical protein